MGVFFIERQLKAILFENLNVSGFMKICMKMWSIETLITRRTIRYIMLLLIGYLH
jgi:hypothetical protein